MTRRPVEAAATSGMIRPPMSPDELDRWLRTPRKLQPVADSLTMLDGFVTAIVAQTAAQSPAHRHSDRSPSWRAWMPIATSRPPSWPSASSGHPAATTAGPDPYSQQPSEPARATPSALTPSLVSPRGRRIARRFARSGYDHSRSRLCLPQQPPAVAEAQLATGRS